MRVLALITVLVGSVALACGSESAPIETASQQRGAASAAPAVPEGQREASAGVLRVADNFILGNLDADVQGGFAWMAYGVAETLVRVTPAMELEPWLAAKVEASDASTWTVTLRNDATFHDRSPVDAAAVKASIERSMQKQPGTATLIPPGTQFAADGLTLTIKTPVPVPTMPNSLAAVNFTIKKMLPDGSVIYTGPFVHGDFVERQSITLTAYEAYRGGPPRIKTIKLREIPDVAARVLALQAGDVDMAQAVLPSAAARLKAGGFEVHSFPFSRQNDILLNVTKAPLDDPAVRRAIALAIDREALVRGVMDGAATVAAALAPENLGLAGLVQTQRTDPAEARRVLDAANWRAGADGVRVKDGRRLSFTLGSYAQRAELEPLSVAIKDQLKAVGIDATLTKYPDINSIVAQSAFEATMYSYPTAPYGNFDYAIQALYTPSGTNKDRYSNARVNALFQEYVQTADEATRQELLRQMQASIAEDVPVIYVVNPYQVVALTKKVKGYTPHPLENYKITPETRID